MGEAEQKRQRYERYLRVAEAAAARECFTLDELKEACREEVPAFVTRAVNQLQRGGLLVRSGQKRRPVFQWVEDRRASFSPAEWAQTQLSGVQLRETPAADRPRERLLAHGAAALRTAELLAILIRSGRRGESALQAGEKLAARFGDHLERLPDAGRGELKAISPAVADTAYCQIMAGVELGRRVAEAVARSGQPRKRRITKPEEAIEECQERFARLISDGVQEEFHVLCLNTKHEVIGVHRISVGSLAGTPVEAREVFRPAIQDAAAAVLLVHNHPSGDPAPSREDVAVTARLEEAGRNLGIEVLDHIVVARRGAVSLRQRGLAGANARS